MKSQPLVSIITPTYNHEKFIGQCIESVLAQTYSCWEQIIIDDGSADRTGEIVMEYKDERIKYIRQDHVGIWRLSETYNKALQISQGKLIAILEGDDFWPYDKLTKQVPVFEKAEIVLSAGRAAVTNRKGEIVYLTPKRLKLIKNLTSREVLVKLLNSNFIPACTVICRKDALLSIGGFKQPKGVPYVDLPTWLELCLVGEVCFLEFTLGFWRRHETQWSAKSIKEMAQGHNECVMAFWKHLPQGVKNSIDFDAQALQNACLHRIVAANFEIGRAKLFEHDWLEARRSFKEVLAKGKLPIKAKALAGIVCSYLKVDMEWLALLEGSPRLSQLFR